LLHALSGKGDFLTYPNLMRASISFLPTPDKSSHRSVFRTLSSPVPVPFFDSHSLNTIAALKKKEPKNKCLPINSRRPNTFFMGINLDEFCSTLPALFDV